MCVTDRPAQEMPTPRRRNGEEATQPDWSDKALDVLLDFTQIFGAVSLFEAAQGMWVIASHVPRAYVGVVLLWSFFTISILHTVSAALEVFEAEFEKNWAVLGLNWTVNFSGLLLFVIVKMAEGDSSLPWLAMVAPAIQTVVLGYALRNVPGRAGGIRAMLFLTNIAMLVSFAVYVHDQSSDVTKLCTDISLFEFDVGVDASDVYAVHIPDDCFDVGRLSGDSVVQARSSLDTARWFYGANVCGVTDKTPSSTRFLLLNYNPIDFASGDGIIDVVLVVLVGVSVVAVGGSFVNLIVASHWPLEKPSKSRKVLKALVVCGWVVLYPVFELLRVLGKLLRWLKCLRINLAGGKYQFALDGKIVLSSQEEFQVGAPVS